MIFPQLEKMMRQVQSCDPVWDVWPMAQLYKYLNISHLLP